jgi:hypothetical protein
MPFFCDCKGLAVPKTGAAIRPITIGDSLYRVTAECCIDLDREAWKDSAGPYALGSGLTAGCEAVGSILSNALDQGMGAMAADSENAYNKRKKQKIADSILGNPKLSHSHKLYHWSYGRPTRILMQDRNGKIVAVISSEEGVRQGDPLGSNGHDASMAPDLAELARRHPKVETRSVHDDVFGIGPVEELMPWFESYKEIARPSNTTVQPAKSVLMYRGDKPIPADMMQWVQEQKIQLKTDAAVVVGTIVAKDEGSAADLIQDELADQAQYQKCLKHPGMSVQNATILLRSSALAKSGYTARSSRFDLTGGLLQSIDEMTWDTFCDKHELGANLPDSAYDEWLTPLRLGGWGFKSLAEIAPLAWFACQAQIAPILVKSRYGTSRQSDELRRRALEMIHELLRKSKADNSELRAKLPPIRAEMNQWYSDQPERAKHLQADLTKLLTEQRVLTQPKSPIEAERRKSNATPESSRFHTTLPLTKETTVKDTEFKLMTRQKMGLKSTEQALPDQCHLCKRPISDSVEDSWHPVYCKSAIPTEMNHKHNEIVKLLARTVAQTGGVASTELRPPCSEEDKRRMDLVVQYGLDKEKAVDVTIRAVKASSRRSKPDKLFHEAERDKLNKYSDLLELHDYEFFPFVINEYAAIGPKGKQFAELMWKQADLRGMPKGELQAVRNSFYSQLAMIIAKESMKPTCARIGQLVYQRSKQDKQRNESAGLLREFKAEISDRMGWQQSERDQMCDELSEQSELDDEEDTPMPDADTKESKESPSPAWLSEQLTFGVNSALSHSSSTLSHASIPALAQSTQLQQQSVSVNNFSVAPSKNQSGQPMLQTDSSAASSSSHMDDDELMWHEPVQGSRSGSEPSASSS